MNRPLCKVCQINYAEINYLKNGIPHYRSKCRKCSKTGRQLKPQKPMWQTRGIKKKPHCEKCGFVAKFNDQLTMHFIDSNLSNCQISNVKTVCLNCQVELSKSNKGWNRGSLTPDI